MGGMQALLSRTTLAGLETEGHGDEHGQRTFDARFGYELPAFGGRFTATPEMAMQRSDTTREYTLGWHPGSTAATRNSIKLSIEGCRREDAGGEAEHTLGLTLRAQF